jgi:beta-alanine--pyruvate transaminase
MGHADPHVTAATHTQDAHAFDNFWMPFSPNKEFKSEPRLFVKGEGMYLWTDDGHKVLDAASGLFCVPAGHCRPEIAEAVYQQLKTLDYTMPFGRGHAKGFQLAREVAEFTPKGLDRLFFLCSGSEAVDTAMKMALAYHRVRGQGHRQIFISRERAYHGVNMGGVALSGMVNNRKVFGVGLPGVYHMRHTALPQNKFVKGQPETGADLADDLQRYCTMYGGENIAAVFVEPTAGSFGCLPPPKGYLDKLRSICDQHGILLVFDDRVGPHGCQLWRAGVRCDAGSDVHGQGHHQWCTTAGRGRSTHRYLRNNHQRGTRQRNRVFPRLHLQRASCLRRGGACDDENFPRRKTD